MIVRSFRLLASTTGPVIPNVRRLELRLILHFVVGCVIYAISGCHRIRESRLLLTIDTKERYVQLNEGRPHYVWRKIGHIDGRPELTDLSDINGGLDWVFAELLGDQSARIIVESKNASPYHLVFPYKDRGVLPLVADALDLAVTTEQRMIDGIDTQVVVVKDKNAATDN